VGLWGNSGWRQQRATVNAHTATVNAHTATVNAHTATVNANSDSRDSWCKVTVGAMTINNLQDSP
jgi:hypothetical protein